MTTFTMGKITIVCEGKLRRGGFKHEATLLRNGVQRDFAKCLYVNRTWERFTFNSVLQKLLGKTDAMTKRQKTLFKKKYFRLHQI
ncbi:hypothetical protein LCGC14_1426100 [marine sediment metagenome]|uniref:Uncharacterized protein n=1 Tax=marine sediment metagenome TaxID=412755 RepID=A0A0F9KB29_9ZZZZ